MKNSLLLFLFAMVLGPAVFMFVSGSSKADLLESRSAFSEQDRPGMLMENPEFSTWERLLCFGYKKSSFCPDTPLRPIGKKLGPGGQRMIEHGFRQKAGKTPQLNPTMRLEEIIK